VPMEITEEGKIISKPTMILRHIGVYEGNGLISDCGISSKNFPFYKHVRMRHYSEISDENKPTHILKLKDKFIPPKSVAYASSNDIEFKHVPKEERANIERKSLADMTPQERYD